MKPHYDQKFYQDLLDSILERKRMDMGVWIGSFKEITTRIFQGDSYDIRAKDAPCNTVACISGHAAFIDPAVSGTAEGGVVIGNKLLNWDDYTDRVFGEASSPLVLEEYWPEFMTITKAFVRLPKYKQAAVALQVYVDKHFGYELSAPDLLIKVANEVKLDSEVA